MAAKRDLLAALREKAKITDRGIRKRREKLQRLVPIPTDIATYILAHRAGVPVQSAEVTRNIVAHMNPIQPRDVRRLADALSDWVKQTEDFDP